MICSNMRIIIIYRWCTTMHIMIPICHAISESTVIKIITKVVAFRFT